ncbi:hypothetical protein N1851_032922 [Merluccius polli]|uniref:Uncharacterized protein n=1 Tax=Merluccius polli TaxID=89951 RepID=A0AA47M257_MERPO|nr:hypothetical protein N1851_032922 [Merluccius polli]
MPQKALIHEMVNRWGSTQKMLELFLSSQSATLPGERGTRHLTPKDTDISVMEQLCQLFEPLGKFTDALASVTLSAIKPVLDHISRDVLASCDLLKCAIFLRYQNDFRYPPFNIRRQV